MDKFWNFATNYADKFYESIDTVGELMRVSFALAMTAGMIIFMAIMIINICKLAAYTIIDWFRKNKE